MDNANTFARVRRCAALALWMTFAWYCGSIGGFNQGHAAAEREIAATKSAHDAEMAKLGLCEWPKAFAQETHCPGY